MSCVLGVYKSLKCCGALTLKASKYFRAYIVFDNLPSEVQIFSIQPLWIRTIRNQRIQFLHHNRLIFLIGHAKPR